MSSEALEATAGPIEANSQTNNLTPNWFAPVEALTRFAPTGRVSLEAENEQLHAEIRHGVRISDTGLLIDAEAASEFILPLPLSRVPNTPEWFSGLMNLRGTLVPVFDVELLLGADSSVMTPSVDGNRQVFLVLGRGEQSAALKIHGYPVSLGRFKALEVKPSVRSPLDQCVGDAFEANGLVWFEFSHGRLFDALSRRLETSGRTDT